MARFQFKLQTVLKHRLLVEEQAQRDLAQFLRHRMILMTQLRNIQETISQSKRELGQGLVGKVDMDQVAQFTRYSGQATTRAQEIVQRLALLEKQIEGSRAKLLKATADRKAMELLRNRYLELWQKEQDRRDVADLDDMASQAYIRHLTAGVES